MKNKLKYIFLLPLAFLFFTTRIDPDFGWHLRLGKEILENNTFTNNITYTCTNYIWTNHSWLSDVDIYWIYIHLGMAILSAFFSFLIILGVYFNYKTFKYLFKDKVSYFHTVLFIIISYLILMAFITIRPQIISFVFISILLNRLVKIYYENLSKKDVVFGIILFLLWGNLHGGFVVGYALISLFILVIFTKFTLLIFQNAKPELAFKKLKESSKFFILILTSLPFTVINPFGFNSWVEAFNNIVSPQNSSFISEWSSVNLKQQYGLLYFLIFISTLVLIILNKKVNYLRLALLLIFGLLSLYTIRYALIAAPIVSICFCVEFIYFYNKTKAFFLTDDVSKLLKSMTTVIPIVFILIISAGGLYNFYDWVKTNLDFKYSINFEFENYPYKSVEFLKTHPEYLKLNIFNFYTWGGYLSWVMPEQKWFIDGRMPAWNCAGKVETNILKDYMELESVGVNWRKAIEAYDIRVVLMNKNSKIVNLLMEDKDWMVVFDEGDEVVLIKI
ncbi:MAG: hypothetical protein ABI721_01580 [Candidatus Dojkabacteria bacterium]